ncbi:MAG: PadR family transcriptional regulator [Streptosporangiales bacterium]|nr:PadR family transcriptional regulator [Streptosporangiales bacterium]
MREEHRHRREEPRGPRGGRSSRPGRPDWDEPGEWGPGRGPGGHGHGRGGPGGRRGGRRGEGPWGGPGPFGPGFFGPGGPGHHGGPFGSGGPRRGRARRGDVRAAILDLLTEDQPWNGYQIIQEIAARTDGIWRPSAGSVYPALQQLEDEGLIAPRGEGRRRMYTLTDEGRAYATEHADELRASWDAVAGMTDEADWELGDLIRQVMMAVMEVRRAGSPAQLAEARRVLTETRRSMYRILADDAAGPAAEPADDEADEAQDDAPEDAE